MYHQRQGYNEPDVLRARFTVWIEKLIKNAKIDYIRQLNKAEPEFVSIDELFEDAMSTQPEPLYYSADGVHPNENGARFIGECYAREVNKLFN